MALAAHKCSWRQANPLSAGKRRLAPGGRAFQSKTASTRPKKMPRHLCCWGAFLCCLSTMLAEKITFVVSPDTHYDQCAGYEDAESDNPNKDVAKNLRGITDMHALPGQSYPAASKRGGVVELGGKVLAGLPAHLQQALLLLL